MKSTRRTAVALLSLTSLMILFQNFDRVPGINRFVELPLGLKASDVRLPANEVLDPAMIELGNLLFFDRRLSKGGTMSCATCHIPSRGYSTIGFSKGVNGVTQPRTTPPATNRLFGTENNWLGQRTLEGQSIAPITAVNEMGLSANEVVAIVSAIPGYKERFDQLVGLGMVPAPSVSMNNISLVIATFQRSLMSANSRVDRYEAGETTALTAAEIAGRGLFQGKARCILCHNGSNYTDEAYHNIVSGCPSGGGACTRPTTSSPEAGRYLVTKNLADLGKFKTPSLRNVALRAPYFHSGIDPDLKTVVHGYNVSGNLDSVIGQDPLLINLGLTSAEEDQVVAFMKALTGTIPQNAALSEPGLSSSLSTRESLWLSPDVFDAAFYRSRYSDLSAFTDAQLKNHWILYGINEGRAASARFFANEYLELYADLGTAFTGSTRYRQALLHYLNPGRREGRVGRHVLAPAFYSSAGYRALNPTVVSALTPHEAAVSHYLTTGLAMRLSAASAPKSHFSVGSGYYYAQSGSYCQYSSKSAFNTARGRADDLGYPRLPYVPPNLGRSGGCP